MVLDAGKMVERGLAPEKVIEHRRVSLDFMCGSANFEAWQMLGKLSCCPCAAVLLFSPEYYMDQIYYRPTGCFPMFEQYPNGP